MNGLTLQCRTYQEKDLTWTIEIKAVWEGERHPAETFKDEGYLSQDDAEIMMVIKANGIKASMERLDREGGF